MEERFVRCRRCHGVFEAGLTNCPRCGAEYTPLEPLSVGDGETYAEKYQGTPYVPPVEQAPARAAGGGRRFGILMAFGGIFIVLAVVVGMMAMTGVFGGGATEPPGIIYAPTPKPTPSPTMPSVVANTLSEIKDPMFNAHLSIRTTLAIDARVTANARAVAQVTTVEADMANGQEGGTVKNGNVQNEFRIVDGVYYSRALPSGKWSAKQSIPPFLLLSPLFAINDLKQIAYDGATIEHGATDRIISTDWYKPDAAKLTGLDLSLYVSVLPQHETLAIFIDDFGDPMYAEFHAWTDAADGTHLLNIVTTYTFTNLHTTAAPFAPGATPVSTPTPTPSPTPSLTPAH